jgi:type IV pilus assembly protein PilQ
MTISSLVLVAFLGSAQLVSIDTNEMDLSDFFRLIGKTANMNVVIHPSVAGKVNLMVKEAPWEQILDLVLKDHGLGREVEGNTMRIAPAATFEAGLKQRAATEEAGLNALPLQTQIYFLNYARAADMALVLSKMLSPRGSVIAYPARTAIIVRDVIRP